MRKIFIQFLFILMLPIAVLAEQSANVGKEIHHSLNTLLMSWNNGSIDQFVNEYKNDAATMYISDTIIMGRENILQRYKSHYSDKDAMGKLSLSEVKVRVLSYKHAIATGTWRVQRLKGADLSGTFSLLYENTPQGWKIIVDHTT